MSGVVCAAVVVIVAVIVAVVLVKRRKNRELSKVSEEKQDEDHNIEVAGANGEVNEEILFV